MGPQELAIAGVLLLSLILFGSSKFANTAREVGHFLGGARHTVEDVKSDLVPDEVDETRRAINEFRTEALYGTERYKGRRKA